MKLDILDTGFAGGPGDTGNRSAGREPDSPAPAGPAHPRRSPGGHDTAVRQRSRRATLRPQPTARRGAAALGAAALIAATAALAGSGPPAAATTTDPVPGVHPALLPFAAQPVRWHDCQLGPNDAVGANLDAAGAQCAEVNVPLDYTAPAGRTITLGLARIRAADQEHRRGILLYNLGGPGGSAVDALPDMRQLVGPAADRYDLVGMDPRFVGRSSALDCGPLLNRDWIRGGGPDLNGFERVADGHAAIAAACAQHADVLPFASTRNTARDLDLVRALLGEERTSFLGYSYGGYLGAVYLQMFPGRADRFVLDSAVDPATYNPRVLRGSGDLLEEALREWAGWAAGHDIQFGLGDTAAEVLGTVDRIYEAAARRPLVVDGVRVDADVLPGLLIAALVDDSVEAAESLAMGVRAFADAASGRTPAANPYLAAFLAGTAADGPDPTRRPDGVGRGAVAPGGAGVPAGGARAGLGLISAFQSAQLAVVCADVPASRVAGEYLADIRRHHPAQPHVAGAIWNITPCSFWPVRPLEPPTRVAGEARALVVAAEKDNRTPYAGNVALHRSLTGSRLVTLRDARAHGVFPGRSACVDNAVDVYLRDGRLPPTDLICARNPTPPGSLPG